MTENAHPNAALAQDEYLVGTTILNANHLPTGLLKVDAAYQLGSKIILAGWCLTRVAMKLFAGSTQLKIRKIRIARTDLADHFKPPSGNSFRFVISANYKHEEPLSLAWAGPEGKEMLCTSPMKLCKTTPAPW